MINVEQKQTFLKYASIAAKACAYSSLLEIPVNMMAGFTNAGEIKKIISDSFEHYKNIIARHKLYMDWMSSSATSESSNKDIIDTIHDIIIDLSSDGFDSKKAIEAFIVESEGKEKISSLIAGYAKKLIGSK